MACLLERALLVGLVVAAWPFEARAEVKFLGPTPYLSVADSPFDMSGLGTTFFFEDFEDGSFDLPLGATSVSFDVRPPSPTTDSVDADDGVIDGSGTKGHSLRPLTVIVEPTGTPRWNQYFFASFDSNLLGFSPNAFGLVVTDGVAQSHPTRVNFLRLFVKENDGTTTASPVLNAADFLDDSDTGETTEDRFVGLRTTTAVAEVSIVMSTVSDTFIDQFEIDHVQFGYVVPELVFFPPAPGILFAFAAVRRGRHLLESKIVVPV